MSKPRKRKAVSRVTKLDPQQPEARDEGPRLLPLEGVERRHSFGSSTELSDIALRPKQPTAEPEHPKKDTHTPGER